MKFFLTIMGLLALLFLVSFRNNRHQKFDQYIETNKSTPPPLTTLDSLQGSWININDQYSEFTVSGRALHDIYIDTSSTSNQTENISYNLYFSDTAVNQYLTQNSTQIKIDTSAKTGTYLVKISPTDSTVWCYKINGFYTDASGTTFSISDIWAHRTASVYKKH